MINTAEVFLWGTRIGAVHLDSNKPFVSFEYDKDFIYSGIEVAPFFMPLSNRVYEFPNLYVDAFRGAPGLLADSLPDKFGNKVIERWLLEQGKTIDDFNVIDRLCYTGKRGMGALEYKPSMLIESTPSEKINIDKMVEFATDILSNQENKILNSADDINYSQLIQLGTSAGGARAKALIAWNEDKQEIRSGQIDAGDGYEYWLMKFDGVGKNGDHGLEDILQYTLIEYAYYLMAIDSKIDMNECRIFKSNGYNHFMTKRFDRDKNEKIHMQTLSALAHIDYNVPGLCSYEQAAEYMKRLGLKYTEVEQFYRRMVFNVILCNNDDHVKNTSFLMDRNGIWRLSPAYDITFAYNSNNKWLKGHQMLINGKSDEINYDDLIVVGKKMDLNINKTKTIINEISEIAEKCDAYFDKVGIKEETSNLISAKIKSSLD